MNAKIVVASAALTMLFTAACKQETAPPKPPAEAAPAGTAQPQLPAAQPQAGAPGPAERTARAVGEAIDDATITAKVKAALIDSAEVKGMDINVETQKGVVQLSGFVSTQAQIDKAVELAKRVTGVIDVQNKMSLKPS